MKVFFSILIIVLLASCSKEVATQADKPAASIAAKLLSYRDANITIRNFEAAVTASGNIKIDFTTVFGNNIKSIEILKGQSATKLCSIYKQTFVSGNLQNENFSTTDTKTEGGSQYYMVKYTLINGDWAYTPVICFAPGVASDNDNN